MGVGAHPEPVDVLAEIEVPILDPDDRVGLLAIHGMRRAAISGNGDDFAYWWASGWSGTVTPTIAPISGPQIPAAHTTMSAGISPRSVMTARTRPSSVRIPVTVWRSRNVAPPSVARRACASETRTALHRPSVGTW